MGYVAVLFYGDNLPAVPARRSPSSTGAGCSWGWRWPRWTGSAAGSGIWVVARELHPNPPLKGMLLAGGMSAWAAYLTPLQSGAAPMMIYTMRRYGVRVPVAMTTTLMTFIATILFFGIAGPLAIFLGRGPVARLARATCSGSRSTISSSGRSASSPGSASLLMVVIVFPQRGPQRHPPAGRSGPAAGAAASRPGSRGCASGIDQAHASVAKFNTPRGWLSLFWATLLSGPSHANKLLAGYVALRVIGIEAHFVDVLLRADADHLPALLRADAGRQRHRRGARPPSS